MRGEIYNTYHENISVKCAYHKCSSQPNGAKHAPDRCKVALWLKYHHKLDNEAVKGLIEVYLKCEEAKEHITTCRVKRKENCPTGEFQGLA